MTGFERPDIADRLVGVVDLFGGAAVHAVAGQRRLYRPVRWCDGDPIQLAHHYYDLGLRRLYVADLNALQGNAIQIDALERLANEIPNVDWLWDVGWTGNASHQARSGIQNLAQRFRRTQWIAATESCRSADAVAELASLLPTDDGPASARVWVSLDYRDQAFLSKVGDESLWVDAGIKHQVGGFIVLDVGNVGTGKGPRTEKICRRVRDSALPEQTICSGGGVRHSDDVQSLVESGCDHIMVATALYPDE